jgi:hypothetical protein
MLKFLLGGFPAISGHFRPKERAFSAGHPQYLWLKQGPLMNTD